MHWYLKNSMKIGIAEIDQQHQNLVDILNRLSAAMAAGPDTEVIDETLADLVDYTFYHFLSEEKYFAKYHYPEAERHSEAHDALVAKLKDLRARHASNEENITPAIMDLLVDWLFGHIKGSDMRFKTYLDQQQTIVTS